MRRVFATFALVGVLITVLGACGTSAPGASSGVVRILSGEPATLDPAAQGDAGSAAITAQLFESLTTFDASLVLRPALAASWRIEEGGTRIVFRLRDGLTFSDGSALRPSDVVRSWLRVIDPGRPSPLASLLLVVKGAREYLAGTGNASAVGLVADDGANTLTVTMERPAADFVDVVASPTFGVVPPAATGAEAFVPADGFVGSGGYRATATGPTTITLTANPAYWAGPPAIGTVELLTDTGGQSAVELYEAGSLDYTAIFGADASWIAYDRQLGPDLRAVKSLVTTYYGFAAGSPPFDDVRVRQAFAMAVDWRRIGLLGSSDADAQATVATSMVPPGIPGRSERDFLPKHDPAAARALLAQAGYPGGAGFPTVSMVTLGAGFDAAIIDELERELGVKVDYETMDFADYFTRLGDDPPDIWSSNWVADYPSRNDFLGVLLGRDSTNDYGRWTSDEFDAALDEAAAATDAAAASAAYDRAETILMNDVPVVPISYGSQWALSRGGLLGAEQNGMGIVRMAGLAWAP